MVRGGRRTALNGLLVPSTARRKDPRMSDSRPSPVLATDGRHLLVVAHTGREDSLRAGVQVCRQLIDAGLVPVVSED